MPIVIQFATAIIITFSYIPFLFAIDIVEIKPKCHVEFGRHEISTMADFMYLSLKDNNALLTDNKRKVIDYLIKKANKLTSRDETGLHKGGNLSNKDWKFTSKDKSYSLKMEFDFDSNQFSVDSTSTSDCDYLCEEYDQPACHERESTYLRRPYTKNVVYDDTGPLKIEVLGFYLGMDIKEAKYLIKKYTGRNWPIKYRKDSNTNGFGASGAAHFGYFIAHKGGNIVTCFRLNKRFLNELLGTHSLSNKEFATWFAKQYKIPNFEYDSRYNEWKYINEGKYRLTVSKENGGIDLYDMSF